ncbi:hypothetical protein AXG93_3873s1010 [Marchantia polymorpha subsp. ruderalis]|uniref:Uncharacterized protein n=1 Tax=Marchantia polymorpha subsp. ruderalis TaxID=1480154 RepID=A0A176VI02_MARPO|nr:hypothetical protein AXG93_3873s1010 [Marchantia polymorpha subsp. ruderalis]
MEAAGVSIVSHAAETRAMDSADEEPELPSVVQDFIRRLEGEGEPITSLSHLREPQFREFFPERASLSTIMGWRSKVRLRVLEAIGNCKTLKHLYLHEICGRDISTLTASEWEVVLRGFRYSTDRLRGNSESTLKSVSLDNAWEDSSAVKHVADIINSATRLESLSLGNIDAMEEETVGILSQALIKSSSLKDLFLNNVNWGAALSLKALAGDDGNRSIERLWLDRMDGFGGCLGELLTSNPSLKRVALYSLRMSREEWHQLGEVIHDNAIASILHVEFNFGYEREHWESIEVLACAASSDVKDPIMELNLTPWREQDGMLALNLLARGPDGVTPSELDFGGNRCLIHLMARGLKGGADSKGPKAKQEAAVYMAVFREAKLTFGDAKGGQLFLCGFPRAGKTKLRQTLMRIVQGKSWMGNKWDELWKTKGIEVEFLENNDKNQISICLTQSIQSSFALTVDHSRIMNSIVSYLNDVGSIVSIPDLDYIIVDPNWLTNTLLGELVALGQDFQVEESRSSNKTLSRYSYTSKDGFVSASVFARLIKEFQRKQSHVQRGVDREIYVQQGRSHKYVDVLMLCSKHKSKEGALKYLTKHIVQELISFCASSKVCPGVALVLGVIQTLCVEMLIPSHLRGVILIEELKSEFIRSIKVNLEDLPLDKSHWEKEEELFNYEHSWPPIEGYTAQVTFERARDLLWDSDVEAVVNEIRQKRMQQLESLQQGLIQRLESLQQGLIKVNDDLIHSYTENENMTTNSNFCELKVSNRPSSRCLSRASTNVKYRSTRLENKIDKLVQKVDGLDGRLRSVESIVQRLDMKMGQIIFLQQELQSTLSAFMSKVDRFIQYSQSFQQARTPKRPYVTDDVGFFYRMSAVLRVGTTVRLHLMCESATGFHYVKDQEGLKIRLDWENCGWIQKTIEISFKVIYYAVKGGLDATLGLGEAIPEWEDLKSDVVKLDGISDRDRMAVLKGGESKELKEAWLRIQQTLAPKLQDSYSSIFKLYQVKYVRPELGGHAWVCEECMVEGRRSGILTY